MGQHEHASRPHAHPTLPSIVITGENKENVGLQAFTIAIVSDSELTRSFAVSRQELIKIFDGRGQAHRQGCARLPIKFFPS